MFRSIPGPFLVHSFPFKYKRPGTGYPELNIEMKTSLFGQVFSYQSPRLFPLSSLNEPLLAGMTVLWREPFTSDALTPASGCRGGSNCIKYVYNLINFRMFWLMNMWKDRHFSILLFRIFSSITNPSPLWNPLELFFSRYTTNSNFLWELNT